MMLAILLLLPLLAAAATNFESESCKAKLSRDPAYIGTINSAAPDHASQLLGERDVLTVYKDCGSGNDVYVDTIIEFAGIPTTVEWCQLELTFGQGYTAVHGFDDLRAKFNVWNVDKTIDTTLNKNDWACGQSANGGRNLTWNNAPKATTAFGREFDFALPSNDDVSVSFARNFTRVVDAKKCESLMTFRVSAKGDIQKGGFQFRQERREENPFGGWRLRAC